MIRTDRVITRAINARTLLPTSLLHDYLWGWRWGVHDA